MLPDYYITWNCKERAGRRKRVQDNVVRVFVLEFELGENWMFMLAASLLVLHQSVEEERFAGLLQEELENFLGRKNFSSVLVFPPLPARLRFLIHKVVELSFPSLESFSVGREPHRRTAIFFQQKRFSERNSHVMSTLPESSSKKTGCSFAGKGCGRGRRLRQEVASISKDSCSPKNSPSALRKPAQALYTPGAFRKQKNNNGDNIDKMSDVVQSCSRVHNLSGTPKERVSGELKSPSAGKGLSDNKVDLFVGVEKTDVNCRINSNGSRKSQGKNTVEDNVLAKNKEDQLSLDEDLCLSQAKQVGSILSVINEPVSVKVPAGGCQEHKDTHKDTHKDNRGSVEHNGENCAVGVSNLCDTRVDNNKLVYRPVSSDNGDTTGLSVRMENSCTIGHVIAHGLTVHSCTKDHGNIQTEKCLGDHDLDIPLKGTFMDRNAFSDNNSSAQDPNTDQDALLARKDSCAKHAVGHPDAGMQTHNNAVGDHDVSQTDESCSTDQIFHIDSACDSPEHVVCRETSTSHSSDPILHTDNVGSSCQADNGGVSIEDCSSTYYADDADDSTDMTDHAIDQTDTSGSYDPVGIPIKDCSSRHHCNDADDGWPDMVNHAIHHTGTSTSCDLDGTLDADHHPNVVGSRESDTTGSEVCEVGSISNGCADAVAGSCHSSGWQKGSSDVYVGSNNQQTCSDEDSLKDCSMLILGDESVANILEEGCDRSVTELAKVSDVDMDNGVDGSDGKLVSKQVSQSEQDASQFVSELASSEAPSEEKKLSDNMAANTTGLACLKFDDSCEKPDSETSLNKISDADTSLQQAPERMRTKDLEEDSNKDCFEKIDVQEGIVVQADIKDNLGTKPKSKRRCKKEEKAKKKEAKLKKTKSAIKSGPDDVERVGVGSPRGVKKAEKRKEVKENELEKLEAKVEEQKEQVEDDWETSWGDDGECLNSEVLAELNEMIDVADVKLEKPQFDYLSFEPKDVVLETGVFDHVVELYDFSPELQTHDLIHALSRFKSQGFEVKWVDDTHALAVFSNHIMAQSAIEECSSPLMKLRPLYDGTQESKRKARQNVDVLQPYKERPKTSKLIANRLVTGALGVRSKMSREERQLEREKIKAERERKLNKEKQKKDLWESEDLQI